MAKRVALVSPEYTQAVSDLNTATDEVAAVLTALRETIKGSMTPAEVEEAKNTIAATAERLRGLSKDPAVPVPDPVPAFQRLKR